MIEIFGHAVHFASQREASMAGIATVHQFGGTFPLMSIGRSFFVGQEPKRGWGPFQVYDRARANEIAIKALQGLGITPVSPTATGWSAASPAASVRLWPSRVPSTLAPPC